MIHRTVLVTGATGSAGGQIVADLANSGVTVKAVCRHPENILQHKNVSAHYADFDEADTFSEHLAGVNTLVLIAPPMDLNGATSSGKIIELAKENNITKIIFISVVGADKLNLVPLKHIETKIKDCGIDYTILRCNFFMEDFSTFWYDAIKRGSVYLPTADGTVSLIAAEDVAKAVTSEVLATKERNKTYNLTGSTAFDFHQITSIIGKAIGRDITYDNISIPLFHERLRDRGRTEDQSRYAVDLIKPAAEGLYSQITDDFTKITGLEPIEFKSFIAQNAESLR